MASLAESLALDFNLLSEIGAQSFFRWCMGPCSGVSFRNHREFGQSDDVIDGRRVAFARIIGLVPSGQDNPIPWGRRGRLFPFGRLLQQRQYALHDNRSRNRGR